MAEHVYHWKHGWIPLDHTAALSKAKGNHERAKAMLADAHSGTAGMHNRSDVAKAVLDLPNVPAAHRDAALAQIHEAAAQHNAMDLVPGDKAKQHAARAAELRAAAERKQAEADRIAGNVGFGDRAAGRLSPSALNQFNRNTDSALRRTVEAQQAAEALNHKANLFEHRAQEAARTHFNADELKGATHVKTDVGWHEVVRVNGKTVTVKTPYSWTDSIAHDKIHAVGRPIPGQPGKIKVYTPGMAA